jgi:hypothetical protein
LPGELQLNLPEGPGLPPYPHKEISVEAVERHFRPFIEATWHLWPSEEERLRRKGAEPFVWRD